ncbi:hypothetical protein A2U01_0104832, partial [Trifolium medium]|nr:hypothetical protein [Trifolium medium]
MAESASPTPEFVVPWACLQDHASKPSSNPSPVTSTKKSFADA